MRKTLQKKIIQVCNAKIDDDPALLMEAAEWWIMTHKLNHFEKAIKIKHMVEAIRC